MFFEFDDLQKLLIDRPYWVVYNGTVDGWLRRNIPFQDFSAGSIWACNEIPNDMGSLFFRLGYIKCRHDNEFQTTITEEHIGKIFELYSDHTVHLVPVCAVEGANSYWFEYTEAVKLSDVVI